MQTISVKLPQKLFNRLEKYCKQTKATQQAGIRDIIARFLAIHEFEEIRKILIPRAQELGIHTDEDVFKLFEDDKKVQTAVKKRPHLSKTPCQLLARWDGLSCHWFC